MAGNSNTIELRLTVKDDGSVVIKQFTGQGISNLKKLEDQSATMTTRMGTGLAQLRSHWLAFAAATAGAVALAKEAIGEFLKQEAAENDLAQAMRNYGDYTREAHKTLVEYASALQQITTYADDNTLAVMANLKAYGMNTEELKRATKAAMDLATAKKMDLWAASELVGKAFVGETQTLARYGLMIDDNIDKGEKFAAVLELINERFGGRAQAELNTYAGQWAQLKNTWSDILEVIGHGLLKALEAVTGAMGWVFSGLMKYLSIISGAWSEIFALAGHLPGKAGEIARGISGSLKNVSAMYQEQSAKSMEFAMKHFHMLTADAKETEQAMTRVHEKRMEQTEQQKKALEGYEKLHEQVTARIMELTLGEADYKIWQLNRWYQEAVAVYKAAGKDIADLTRLQALERASILGGAGAAIGGLTAEGAERAATERRTLAEQWAEMERTISHDLMTESGRRRAVVLEEFNARMLQLDLFLQKGIITEDAYTQAIADSAAAREKLLKEMEEAEKGYLVYLEEMNKQTALNIQQSWSSLLSGLMKGEFESVGDWFNAFLDSLYDTWADTLAKMAYTWVNDFVGQLSSTSGAGAGGGGGFNWGGLLSGLLSGLVGALQYGDVLHRGRIHPFARGTVVTEPTIFPMAEGYGLMGEKGYEAVMPLARTPKGELGVKTTGEGRHTVINGPMVQFNITTPDVDSFRPTKGQLMAEATLAVQRGMRNN